MSGKYQPLTEALHAAGNRGEQTVELAFDEISELVGGLPLSAGRREWWANGSHSQARAWRAAGFRVDHVYLERRRAALRMSNWAPPTPPETGARAG